MRFFTLPPSFVFSLAGGPLVEAAHDRPGFIAPLSAVTAAVLGSIRNLAPFFGCRVPWLQGFGPRCHGLAVALKLTLLRCWVGIPPLLGC